MGPNGANKLLYSKVNHKQNEMTTHRLRKYLQMMQPTRA